MVCPDPLPQPASTARAAPSDHGAGSTSNSFSTSTHRQLLLSRDAGHGAPPPQQPQPWKDCSSSRCLSPGRRSPAAPTLLPTPWRSAALSCSECPQCVKQLLPPPSSPFRAAADASSTEEQQRRHGGVVNAAGEARKRRAVWIDPELTAADSPSHQGFVPDLRCTSSIRQLHILYNHDPHPWSFPCLQKRVDSSVKQLLPTPCSSSQLHLLPSTPEPMPPPWRNTIEEAWRSGRRRPVKACKRRAAWIDPELTAADSPSHQGFIPALRCTSSIRQLQIPYNHGLHPWSFPCLQQLLDSRKFVASLEKREQPDHLPTEVDAAAPGVDPEDEPIASLTLMVTLSRSTMILTSVAFVRRICGITQLDSGNWWIICWWWYYYFCFTEHTLHSTSVVLRLVLLLPALTTVVLPMVLVPMLVVVLR